jgi:DNA-binding transcriptional ArsR family regulator
MSLLPSEPDTSAAEEADPRVIGVDSDDADDVLSALSSETARELLSALHRDPAPPAEVADRVGTSLQNAQYHIEKLENAGAIEVIDTVYSEKGREMNVYAPADRPLVIFAGDEDQTTGIRAALSRLLGSLGILAVASLAVQAVFGNGLLNMGSAPGGGDAGGQESGAPAPGAAPGGPAGNESTATETATSSPGSEDVAARASETTSDGGGFNIAEATETGGDATATATAPTAGGGGGATSTPAPSQTQTATELPATTQAPTATEAPAETQAEATRTATDVVNETARNATEAAPQAGDAVASAFAMEPGVLFFLGGATALCIGAAIWYATD